MPNPAPKPDRIAAMSVAMFGNEARLRVAAAIHSAMLAGEMVSARDLEESSGLRYGPVRTDVRRLFDGKLLESVGEGEGGRQLYQPVDTVYWKMCADLLSELQ
jgi:hypothetical protein